MPRAEQRPMTPALLKHLDEKARPFQTDLIHRTRQSISEGKDPLVVSPTGSGKGFMICRIVAGAIARGKRVVFGVNRRSLVFDLSKRLDHLGIDHGIIMADHWRRKPSAMVHVASIATLLGRDRPPADLFIADEAHFSVSDGWLQIFERYKGRPVIGFTATPIRGDGRGLGRFFDVMHVGPSVAELTAQGYLVPATIYGPEKQQKEKRHLVGDIVENWLKNGRGEPTICFAASVSQSKRIVEEFRAAGVNATHVDANTPDAIRERTWEQLQSYDIEVVSSVGIISYGWDAPRVSQMIDAAARGNVGAQIQAWGRILRPADGKREARVWDHAGNYLVHGFPDDDRQWSLEDGYIPPNRCGACGHSKTVHLQNLKCSAPNCRCTEFIAAKTDPGIYTCHECYMPYRISVDACPKCGAPRKKLSAELETIAGELVQTQAKKKYYRCQHCEQRGVLDGGGYDQPCPRCGVAALVSLAQAEPVFTPAQLAEQRTWFMRAAEDSVKLGFGVTRAATHFLARYGAYAPKRWRDEAAKIYSNDWSTS